MAQPQAIPELLERGLSLHRSGRIDDAKVVYQQILSQFPEHPDALHLLGTAVLQGGDPQGAARLLGKAVARQPDNSAFQANLANALFQSGDFAEALAAFRRAAALEPGQPQFQMGVANCHAACGRHADAEAQLRAITRRFPSFALAWFNLGNVMRDQARNAEAVEHYRRAIEADPHLPDAHNSLGQALHASGQFREAESAYRRALALVPDSTMFLCNLGSVLLDCGRCSEAEAVFRQAVARSPDLAIAHSVLGAALGHQGRLREAMECYRRAATLDPSNMRAQLALACALCALGLPQEGLPLFDRALTLEPDSSEAHTALATAQLAQGNFRDGWREYLYRPHRRQFVLRHPEVSLSSALPESLAGQRVCVVVEQGLGDQLFFLRFTGELKARGAYVTYRSPAKIASLLARVTTIDRVIADTEPVPPADHTLRAGDLPLALDAGAAPLLPPPLAITPLAEQLSAMRERLAALGPPPYVALTWRAGTAPEAQGATAMLSKAIPPDQLGAALRGIDATWLAVQRHPGAGEIERIAAAIGRPVHDLAALNEDLEAMLALLALIDDYVGVSNTNMHLRAGVGRTARVLVPRPAEWRWMTQGGESPWFPGFTIYRQTGDGDWNAALTQLQKDLLVFACRGSSR